MRLGVRVPLKNLPIPRGLSCQFKTKGGSMLSELAQNLGLYKFLYDIDQKLADEQKRKGCAHCNGRLHQANYYRKPRGGPEEVGDELPIRRSFCCAVEGCRRRATPPSVLFMGRRVYWGAVVLIATTLLQGRLPEHSMGKLQRKFGMVGKTLKRWMAYFHEVFPISRAWQSLRGRVSSEIRNRNLPRDLLMSFMRAKPEGEGTAVAACLKFLADGRGI